MFRRVVAWASDNPLRTAGGAGALAAIAVMWVSVGAKVSSSSGRTAITGASSSEFVSFSLSHPAYPVLVLVGIAALLFLGD